MPDWLEITLSGLGGAVVSAVVTWVIFKKSQPQPDGKAWELLKALGLVLGKQEGEVYFTKSTNDHYRVAAHIYSHSDASIVATAFHEDPIQYGHNDLIRSFQFGGSLIRRLTSAEVCASESATQAQEVMNAILPGATLVVIPTGTKYVRFDGIFCRFNDGSHLCLLAFRNPVDGAKNKGVVFRDGMASSFFEYYSDLANLYHH